MKKSSGLDKFFTAGSFDSVDQHQVFIADIRHKRTVLERLQVFKRQSRSVSGHGKYCIINLWRVAARRGIRRGVVGGSRHDYAAL